MDSTIRSGESDLGFPVVLVVLRGKVSMRRDTCCSFIQLRGCVVERAHFFLLCWLCWNRCCRKVITWVWVSTTQLCNGVECTGLLAGNHNRILHWTLYHQGILLGLLVLPPWAIWMTGIEFPNFTMTWNKTVGFHYTHLLLYMPIYTLYCFAIHLLPFQPWNLGNLFIICLLSLSFWQPFPKHWSLDWSSSSTF